MSWIRRRRARYYVMTRGGVRFGPYLRYTAAERAALACGGYVVTRDNNVIGGSQ
jgi:hypothetical protein